MSYLNDALHLFHDLTKKPEAFLSNENVISSKIESFLKGSYDYTKQQETDAFKSNALPELITQNFDIEQIWQQIELQNDAFLTHSLMNVSKFVVARSRLVFDEVARKAIAPDADEDEGNEVEKPHSDDDDSSSSSDDDAPLNLEEDSGDNALYSDDLSDNENDDPAAASGPMKKYKPSVVDDKFFKLNEMEAFLQAEEKRMDNEEPDSGNDSDEEDEEDEEEDVDLFKADGIENTGTERGGLNNPKYKDFFIEQEDATAGSLGSKRNKFLEELGSDEEEQQQQQLLDDAEEENPMEQTKSTLEEREERLKRKMEYLEEAAVGEKPWQLKGEITADGRPQNSLLEEVVEFDLTTRPAPVMTEETSMLLEDVIRQRIKDKAFDSVERKEKPVEAPLEYKKKLVLDQEKSKQSLAQIYEKEYLQLTEAQQPDAADKEEEEPQVHKDIKKMMHGLFAKLDALSNFHLTPKPVHAELRVVSNLPAIAMEEVAPVAASDAALLAPEEVKAKVRGDIIGKSERSATDKKRERRKKKAKQHEHAVLKVKKDQLGLGNKYSKEKAQKMLEQITKDKNVDKMDETLGSKSVKSSTAFFSQLEDEVKAQMKSKHATKKKQPPKARFDAKKMKL